MIQGLLLKVTTAVVLSNEGCSRLRAAEKASVFGSEFPATLCCGVMSENLFRYQICWITVL